MAVFRVEKTKDFTVMSNHHPVSYTHLMIRKAKIIDESEMDIDRVSVGLKVKVQDTATGEEMEGLIYLEDGTVFKGIGFGARGTAVGELVFNTSMTGCLLYTSRCV